MSSFESVAEHAVIKGLFVSMQASFNDCNTVPGPDRGSVYQPCSYWPSGLLGCWARSASGCYVPACDDLLVCLPVCLLLACLYLSSYLFGSLLLTASLSSCQTTCRGVSLLPLWTSPVQLHFFAFPPACQSYCSSCRAVSLSSSLGCLLSFCLPGCLSGCLASQPRDVWIGAG